MDQVWTHGRWKVRKGREGDFLAALRALDRDASREVGAPRPKLLRDRQQPDLFLTFGSWDSIETIERFRGFALPRIGAMDELLESFEAFTLDEIPIDD